MATEPPRRVAVYVRISDDAEYLRLGVERQREDCVAYVKAQGWELVEVIEDNDISAHDRRKVRPGYRALLVALEAGEVDAVVCWKLDRLYRQVRELEDLVELAESGRCTIYAAQGSAYDLNTTDGRAMARIGVTIAMQASEVASERVRRAHLQLAREGKPSGGGRRSYGYDAEGLTVVEEEAAVVRECAARIAQGEAILRVTKDLNARELLTSQGKPWTGPTLRRMLLSRDCRALR